ncbi:MAG: hypothetical protein O7D91_15940 [Planctomycetota bacterium]|nr:hypothetical protein [Planctomycetota bacterium]
MDILDTSAIRGLKKDDIHAIAQRRDVGVSPISVYEILCHLDEQKKGETREQAFARRRGMVGKMRGLQILDEPHTQHAIAVGAQSLADPTRFEDRDIANRMIEEVVQASNLADLSKRTITLTDGRQAAFGALAASTRVVLEAEVKQHADDVQKMWSAMQKLSSASSPADLTDKDLWEWLKATVIAHTRSYEHDGVLEDHLLGKVTRSLFAYHGYLFARLRKYTRNSAGELEVPANDTEDGYICMHLDLLEEDVLVTGDANTIDALAAALDIWNKHGPSEIAPACAVMSIEQYKNTLDRLSSPVADHLPVYVLCFVWLVAVVLLVAIITEFASR